MTRPFVPSMELLPRVAAGDPAAVARLMARAEAGSEEVRPALGEIYRRAGRAHVIGVTGPPGSGKSTLVGRLIGRLRALDRSVAVVAVDPSSPYSGGAILGDRLRMTEGLASGLSARQRCAAGAPRLWSLHGTRRK